MHSNLEELAAKDEKPHTNNTKQTWFERVVLLVAILKKEKIYTFKIYLVKGTIFTTCKKNCTIKIWNFYFSYCTLIRYLITCHSHMTDSELPVIRNTEFPFSYIIPAGKGPVRHPYLCNICMWPYVSVLWNCDLRGHFSWCVNTQKTF